MRQRLVKNMEGRYEWVEIEHLPPVQQRKMNAQGEDLTVDGYINKYGGIESNIDGKIYTTKGAYMDHIKQSGRVIKDY